MTILKKNIVYKTFYVKNLYFSESILHDQFIEPFNCL